MQTVFRLLFSALAAASLCVYAAVAVSAAATAATAAADTSVSDDTATAAAGGPFSFALLQDRARALAAAPWQARASRVPGPLLALDYDRHRDIRFDPAQSLWRAENLPFRLQFFHPGFIHGRTVRVHEAADGRAREIPFSKNLFDYGKNTALAAALSDDSAGMGFSGLRVLTPLNTPGRFDELIVFQGASYFRALPRGARYGLSARGLALNTAEPGGEEFPVFEEFWAGRPGPGAREIVIHALLDSPGVAGAYQFSIAPGAATVARVRAVLFLRAGAEKNVRVLGIAPLTSMFWFGENSPARHGDLRPEVHDSDGLALHTGAGEWLWRPLDNPRAVRTAAFSDRNPRGFGLAQRDRAFASYEDIEAAYHLRPSAWVEPVGDWGRGEVRLVEIPTPDETNDNIVAFWTPAQLPPAGHPLAFEYRLHWHLDAAAAGTTAATAGKGARAPDPWPAADAATDAADAADAATAGGATDAAAAATPSSAATAAIAQPPGGRVVATRQGRSLTHEPDLRRFWVDFAGNGLAELPADAAGIEAVVTVGDGAKLAHAGVEKNPFNRTWRAAFAIKPDGSGRPVELRCFLRAAAAAATAASSSAGPGATATTAGPGATAAGASAAAASSDGPGPAAALTETWSYLWNQ
ncbi:MAG: glucan biosynthesis protein [Opitutaceae bacterium]|jgi:glucans biosynthesis protein|nr:glucan biosynthesis protein [Opitutaceae bacterium]